MARSLSTKKHHNNGWLPRVGLGRDDCFKCLHAWCTWLELANLPGRERDIRLEK
jgi:hypothetical protein